MSLFVRKSRERLITELYESKLAERDRVVRLLAEQVEYLRAQLNLPTSTVGMALAEPVEYAPSEEMQVIPAFGGDDQDELEAMRQAGVITDDEYHQALANLEAGAHIIE